MKKMRMGIIVLVLVVAVGFYIISTLNKTIEIQEPSPLEQPVVKDALTAMSETEKKEFGEAVAAMADQVIVMDDVMPTSSFIVFKGEFMKNFHEAKGVAQVIQSNGDLTLRFEDFETLNGPGLYIYLSSDLGDNDFIDLGKIKATKGNVNYAVPPGTDLERYNKVLIWCRPFGVLFSYAELK